MGELPKSKSSQPGNQPPSPPCRIDSPGICCFQYSEFLCYSWLSVFHWCIYLWSTCTSYYNWSCIISANVGPGHALRNGTMTGVWKFRKFNSPTHHCDKKSCLTSYTSRFCPLYRRANEQQRVRRDWIFFHLLLLLLGRRRLRRLPKRDCRLCQQDCAGRCFKRRSESLDFWAAEAFYESVPLICVLWMLWHRDRCSVDPMVTLPSKMAQRYLFETSGPTSPILPAPVSSVPYASLIWWSVGNVINLISYVLKRFSKSYSPGSSLPALEKYEVSWPANEQFTCYIDIFTSWLRFPGLKSARDSPLYPVSLNLPCFKIIVDDDDSSGYHIFSNELSDIISLFSWVRK